MTIKLASALAALVLAGASAAAAAPYARKALCPGCNVVLVSFDALQAAHVHALGYPRDTTPAIDALAAEGTLFGQAISAAPWTVPSHMSWFTGTYPSLHKVVNKYAQTADGSLELSNLKKLSPGLETMAEALHGAGYATGGFTGAAGVSGVFGFKQGFDVYFDSTPAFSGMETSIPKALAWLDEVGPSDASKPFFLFLHGYGIHGQYLPPGGYDKRYVQPPYLGPYDGTPSQQRVLRELGLRGPIELDPVDVDFWRQLYDEKIARTDARFAEFVKALRSRKLPRPTVFVLASDHGTEEYEHHKFDHGYTLYDEMEHVLLAIVVPGLEGNRVVQEQVGMIDMMPTILDIVGVKADARLAAQMKGRSLAPMLTGRKALGEDVYMETDYRLFTRKRGLRTADGWKLVYTLESGKTELYDWKDDPQERRDLAAAEPQRAARLKKTLLDHYASLGLKLDGLAMGCSPVYADQCR